MWTVNLAGFAIGFAMFGSYILIPQLVQTPSSTGYGFGASVTLSGIYLLPSALLMLVSGPLSGRISTKHGSRRPLMLGTVAAGHRVLHASPRCTPSRGRSCSAARRSASGSASRSPRWRTSSSTRSRRR